MQDNLTLFILNLIEDTVVDLMDRCYIQPEMGLAVYSKEDIDRVITRLELVVSSMTEGRIDA